MRLRWKFIRINFSIYPMVALGAAYENGATYRGLSIAILFLMIEISIVRKEDR